MDRIAGSIVAASATPGNNQHKRVAALLTQLSQDFERLTDVGWWCVDLESGELSWSLGTFRLHSVDPSVAMDVDRALAFYDVADRPRISEIVAAGIASRTGFTFDSTILTTDGVPRRVRSSGLIKSIEGREYLLGTIQDISEFFDTSLTATWLSYRDTLTSLANRRALYDLGDEALRTGKGALALVDVDNLKAINDVFGHSVGDSAILAVGNALRDGFPFGCVARIGGDEFCVFVEGCTPEQMAEAFRPIMSALNRPTAAQGACIALGGSVGVTAYDRGEDINTVLKRADRAMYVSKNVRRGGVTIFTEALREEAHKRDHSVSIVRHALENGSMATYFQPIVDPLANAILGFEALLRCEGRNGQPLRVDLATAFADSNLSRAILPRVVADSCAFAAAIGRPVNVNATFFDVVGTDFFDILEHHRRRNRLPRRQIVIEVTENAILSDRSNLFLERIVTLADAGYRIALDDFGTGYSSLTHLRELAVEKIKIDKSFIERLDDERDRILVKGIVDLSRAIGVGVVAEGVETMAQALTLLDLGCVAMQGHFFGKARPARDYLSAANGTPAPFALPGALPLAAPQGRSNRTAGFATGRARYTPTAANLS